MGKKKFLLTVAIAIIFVFFIGYGIEVFHDAPESAKFCPEVYELTNESACQEAGGIWDDLLEPRAEGVKGIKESVPVKGYFCRNTKECYQEFETAQNQHDLVVFVVAIIIGILAIIAGVMLNKDAISTGILAGGVLLLLYGTIRYWRHADDVLKFILLGIALAVLIWLGYKQFDKR
ncbi:hypothetical protein COV12_01540 [Candidatus Woesearchaeota archaeon CG10_big_fil_rev_8_21_14_0_10_32_24]|nr:MAG: hypothetical protein COV12_01540 [Candidatus Woesearchaeota archaeon CG10_big_fil_rev_8_21_14_0_10_32_24]